jgi:hypothetical protein
MKPMNWRHVFYLSVIIPVFCFSLPANGQQNECRVINPAIGESYSGGCKNGLAQGKGIAQGTDHYEGQFSNGKPEGKGTYTWADGSHYEGQWKNGLRDGKGKMVIGDSIRTGFWKNDKFVGSSMPAPYKITENLSVSRYSFNKSREDINGIKIRIMQDGMDNTSIEDFSIAYDNGDEYRMGKYMGIQNTQPPTSVKIRYRTWNHFHSAQYNVVFEFTIYDTGTWDVILNN